MVDKATPNQDSLTSKRGTRPSWKTIAVLAVLSLGAGLATPMAYDRWLKPPDALEELNVATPSEVAFVPFGEVVVNLDDGRLSRYLRVSVTLQVNRSDAELVAKQVEEKRAILRDWVVRNLSDKTMEEIRGAAGQNRLRREIHEQFNTILFRDGRDRIHEVLFEEFNVQ